MPIHHALQLAYANPKFGGGYFDRSLGSAQILGQHLVVQLLRQERAALRVPLVSEDASEFLGGVVPDISPVLVSRVQRERDGALAVLAG